MVCMVYGVWCSLFKGRHWNQPATIGEKALTKYKLGSLSVSRFQAQSPVSVPVPVAVAVAGPSRSQPFPNLAGISHAPACISSGMLRVLYRWSLSRGSVLMSWVRGRELELELWKWEAKAGGRAAEIPICRLRLWPC